MKPFLLLMCCCLALSAADVPLPDFKVLGQPYDQATKPKVIDPAYDAALAAKHIVGGGYSYGDNQVLRQDWAYSTTLYTEKIIEKAVMKAFRPIKVHEGVIDNDQTKTWYVKDLKLWIRLSHAKDGPFSNQIRLEYVGPGWVGRINKKFAALYPTPK